MEVFNHRTLDLESDVMLYTGFRTSFFKFWSRTRRHHSNLTHLSIKLLVRSLLIHSINCWNCSYYLLGGDVSLKLQWRHNPILQWFHWICSFTCAFTALWKSIGSKNPLASFQASPTNEQIKQHITPSCCLNKNKRLLTLLIAYPISTAFFPLFYLLLKVNSGQRPNEANYRIEIDDDDCLLRWRSPSKPTSSCSSSTNDWIFSYHLNINIKINENVDVLGFQHDDTNYIVN